MSFMLWVLGTGNYFEVPEFSTIYKIWLQWIFWVEFDLYVPSCVWLTRKCKNSSIFFLMRNVLFLILGTGNDFEEPEFGTIYKIWLLWIFWVEFDLCVPSCVWLTRKCKKSSILFLMRNVLFLKLLMWLFK